MKINFTWAWICWDYITCMMSQDEGALSSLGTNESTKPLTSTDYNPAPQKHCLTNYLKNNVPGASSNIRSYTGNEFILKWISKIISYDGQRRYNHNSYKLYKHMKHFKTQMNLQIRFVYICFWIVNLIGIYKILCPLKFEKIHFTWTLIRWD